MHKSFYCLLLALLAIPGVVQAHGTVTRTSAAEATVVTITHDDGDAVAGARFDVFPPDSDTAFLSGATDARGRVVFLPDRAGNWRVRIATPDGHGADVQVAIDQSRLVAAVPPPRGSGGVVMGFCVLFGIFGVVALVTRRTR
jgi:nickel transport protein